MKNHYISQENEIKNLLSTINYLSNQFNKYKSILKNINFWTNGFKTNNNILSYNDVINNSFLLPQNKKEYLSFFQSYEDYIIEKNRKEIINAYKEDREPQLLNIYYPDNEWDYIMGNDKLNNITKKQRLKNFWVLWENPRWCFFDI